MAKRKSLFDTPDKTTIRFTERDIELFELAAETEGADSVVQWLLTTGRKRARLIEAGGPLRVTEVLISPPEQTRIEPK
jgi:hypothetical protein